MENGWRGNASGSTGHTGITYGPAGVTFAALGDGVGAVFDVAKPTSLEHAVITMVVNASADFTTSGAGLQLFAQLKEDWAKGEWDCLVASSELRPGVDTTLSCTIDEADDKFNQAERDVQVGLQAKGTAAGIITIKSASITLAQEAYNAHVEQLYALAPSAFPVGIAVSNSDSATYNLLTNHQEQALVKRHFNQVTAGNIMKMKYLQETAGNFTFSNADAFVDWAAANHLSVHGHALVWHSSYQVPDFMKNWSGSAEDFLQALENHVTHIVSHYDAKGNVVSWDVVNEAISDAPSAPLRTSDSIFYTHSGNSAVYIERAFQAARLASPTAELYYNDYNIEQNTEKTNTLIALVNDLIARDIPIDGVGFQMHIFLDYPNIASISAAMKKVVDTGLKVKITELDIAINNPYSPQWPGNKAPTLTSSLALSQQQRYCEVIQAYLNTVPAAQRGGISVWGTTDANTWLTSAITQYQGEAIGWPLLFDNYYNDKPALRGFADGLLGSACTTPH